VSPADIPLTDAGNAERLVAQHGRDLRYVPEVGWHTWDGRRWRPDADGEVIRRMIKTIRSLAATAPVSRQGPLAKHVIRSEERGRLNAAVALASVSEAVIAPASSLDSSPMLLNVANGTIELESGRLRGHDRDDLLTKLAPVEYNPGASAPTWQRFLRKIFDENEDLIGFVQRAVGYSLTARTDEQVLFLPHGSGANGKSTFLEALRAGLGEYAQQAPAEMFMERRGDGVRNDVARLRGARFLAAVETSEGRRLDETLVKRVTGGDTVAARHLYREYFEFVPVAKLWLATNHLPEIRGGDEAIWRRVRLIPFDVFIPEHERDASLGRRLRGELPGVLRWAVEGAVNWCERGLGNSAAVVNATEDYRDNMDALGAFIAEKCMEEPSAEISASELFNAYGYWAASANEEQLTKKAFGLRLRERGFKATRDGQARFYKGLRLRTESDA
jgi:putative DNA primase/helicase